MNISRKTPGDAPLSEEDLHALADNRLDPERRAKAEAWLSGHPEARAAFDAWQAQRAGLHRAYDAVLDEPIPGRLLEAARKAESRPGAPLLRRVAALGWIALGGLLGVLADRQFFHGKAPAPWTALPRQAALAHVAFAPEVRHPVDVGADQEGHLIAWLSKRLGAPVRPPRLETEGYLLMGGRLLPGAEAGAPVAQFMYQDGEGRRVTLYLRRSPGAPSGEAAFRFAQEGPVSVFYWIEGGFGYALSGEMPREKLLRTANAVYRQLVP